MADQENQHTTGKQNEFLQNTYKEFDAVYQAPKASMWDAQEGEQDDKSKFVAAIAFNTLMTISGMAVLVVISCMNRDFNKMLLSNTTWLVSLIVILGLGYFLLTNKDLRENTSVSIWLFILWALSLAVLGAAMMTFMDNGRIVLTLFFSKVAAFIGLYTAANRNKKIENIQKNMVVGFIMTMVMIIVCVCLVEWRSRGEGVIGGSLLLTLSMLVGGLVCFYFTFAVTKIQLPEAESDLNDVLLYSTRVYIDILYAFFLVLALIWDRIWNGKQ